MSELAFNANGDNFEIPAIVTGWRVRRMKPRGAPELVYGRDGRPLTIPIESEMTDLRDAVGGVLGRYRLDPLNDDGRVIDSVPAAYIQVVKAERSTDASPAPVVSEGESVLREAMRFNTELAKSVVDRFPEMMQAAAELLRAADGAGLPARPPRVVDGDEEDGEDDDDDVRPAGFDLNNLVAQLVPMLMMGLGKGKLKMPGLGELLDWRKASPPAPTKPRVEKTPKPAEAGELADQVPDNANDVLPPIAPQTMAHFVAVQSALSPEEAAIAREVAKELSAGELRAWFDELSALSVPEAVEKVRKLISGFGKTGGAS